MAKRQGGSTAGGTALSFGDMLSNYRFIGFTILSDAEDGSSYGYGGGTKLLDYGSLARQHRRRRVSRRQRERAGTGHTGAVPVRRDRSRLGRRPAAQGLKNSG